MITKYSGERGALIDARSTCTEAGRGPMQAGQADEGRLPKRGQLCSGLSGRVQALRR
jgi:hypothetical protein